MNDVPDQIAPIIVFVFRDKIEGFRFLYQPIQRIIVILGGVFFLIRIGNDIALDIILIFSGQGCIGVWQTRVYLNLIKTLLPVQGQVEV